MAAQKVYGKNIDGGTNSNNAPQLILSKNRWRVPKEQRRNPPEKSHGIL
jgi:hypothetical protein